MTRTLGSNDRWRESGVPFRGASARAALVPSFGDVAVDGSAGVFGTPILREGFDTRTGLLMWGSPTSSIDTVTSIAMPALVVVHARPALRS